MMDIFIRFLNQMNFYYLLSLLIILIVIDHFIIFKKLMLYKEKYPIDKLWKVENAQILERYIGHIPLIISDFSITSEFVNLKLRLIAIILWGSQIIFFDTNYIGNLGGLCFIGIILWFMYKKIRIMTLWKEIYQIMEQINSTKV